jgi:hypothetical protein
MTAPLIESIENRIILHFEDLEQALQLLKPWNGAQRRAEATRLVNQALESAGIILEVRVKGRSVAQLGLGDMHGSLFSLLGLAQAR